MKNLIAATAIILASATGAFAQSSALDVEGSQFAKNNVAIDYAATASIGEQRIAEMRARLGDGSPVYLPANVGNVDFNATASIGNDEVQRDRLGDGSPRY